MLPFSARNIHYSDIFRNNRKIRWICRTVIITVPTVEFPVSAFWRQTGEVVSFQMLFSQEQTEINGRHRWLLEREVSNSEKKNIPMKMFSFSNQQSKTLHFVRLCHLLRRMSHRNRKSHAFFIFNNLWRIHSCSHNSNGCTDSPFLHWLLHSVHLSISLVETLLGTFALIFCMTSPLTRGTSIEDSTSIKPALNNLSLIRTFSFMSAPMITDDFPATCILTQSLFSSHFHFISDKSKALNCLLLSSDLPSNPYCYKWTTKCYSKSFISLTHISSELLYSFDYDVPKRSPLPRRDWKLSEEIDRIKWMCFHYHDCLSFPKNFIG